MRAAAVSLCASLRPSVFNTAILTAGEKKRKRTKKKKSCSALPFLPVQIQLHAAKSLHYLSSSIHYLETQREQASKDAFSVLMC